MTVLYTPGQLRGAVSIAPETYRHWKKALGRLQRGRGHSPCFSSGDLVAVAVIKSLAVDMGVRIGALAPLGEPLFDLCNQSPWPVLERTKLIIDLPGAQLQLRPELAEIFSDRPSITVPLRPVVTQLREQLLAASNVDEQPSLRFSPIPVGASTAARGGRR